MYAYVNPVVALLLGWALRGESLNGRVLLAPARRQASSAPASDPPSRTGRHTGWGSSSCHRCPQSLPGEADVSELV